jgi:pyridoxamine 5'-phosphate oxidase
MADESPIERYLLAAARAEAQGIDTSPVALATADASGRPAVRIVLIRHVDERGFVFHTNYNSRKGVELRENPRAALCFFWPFLEEQIRIEGPIERIDARESDAYFAGRPRGSQIGAWASDQSAALASPEMVVSRVRELERRFEGQAVPRPPHWGGIRVVPDKIEFWYGRPNRLHERLLYVKDGTRWTLTYLSP